MWKVAWKGLLARRVRLALTALAVILGVGFIAGTFVLTDTMNTAFDRLFSRAAADVDLYVRRQSAFESLTGGSRQPVPESLLARVQGVEGVGVAVGSVGGYAQFVDKLGKAIAPGGPPTLGSNWTPPPLNPWRLRQGSEPRGPGEVLVDAATARKNGFEVGDKVKVLTAADSRDFIISGIAGFGSASNLGGATLAIFDTRTAQALFGKVGQFDSIDVAAARGVSPRQLRARLAPLLPEGVEVVQATTVAQEQAASVKKGLSFLNIALLVFAGIALFVGAFLIYNTFGITVAQRTRELGLLRALGASGRQIVGSVILEALGVGLFASAVGMATGVGIALGLRKILAAFGIELPATALQVLPRTVVVSLLAGTLVTFAASVLPAMKAAKISPMEALRADLAAGGDRVSRRRTLIGTLVSALGMALLAIGLFARLPQPVTFVGAGAAVTFLGVATLAPRFAGPVAGAVGLLLVYGNAPARLARKNVARNPRRAGSTASALMVGLALVAVMAILAASVKASTAKVLQDSFKADFTVTITGFGGGGMGISPRLAQRIAGKPEIAAAVPMRFGQFRYKGQGRFFVATDPARFLQVADLKVFKGGLTPLARAGTVVLYKPLARELGLGVGDWLPVEFAATGKQNLQVVGLFDNRATVGTDYLVSIATYDANVPNPVDIKVFVKGKQGISAAQVRRAVMAASRDFPGVQVLDQTEAERSSAQQVNQAMGFVSALLALSLVIALFGITNTLALSVFERTRELGLLRAVGMLRSQVRAMIRREAVIIAILGAVLGMVIGLLFGWALVTALKGEGVSQLGIPVGQLLLYVAMAALAGVVAALPPARKAARLEVLQAISVE